MSAPRFDPALFAAALFDGALPVTAVQDDCGIAADERFAIYRNNVVQGLVVALETRFPAVRRSVGDEFFAHLARAYATGEHPRSPIMALYGDTFPQFLARFAPCAELPYLADLAELEAARTRAYHAEDVTPLPAEAFSTLAADELAALRVRLHPSLFVLASPYPIATIFAMNMGELPLAEIAEWRGEEICVVRPCMTVHLHVLPTGGAAFLGKLSAGATLADAAEAVLAAESSFDLAANLAGVIGNGLAIEIMSAHADRPNRSAMKGSGRWRA